MNLRKGTKYAPLVISLLLFICHTANAQQTTQTKQSKAREKTVTKKAEGKFEVKVTPLAGEPNVGDPLISRLSLEKQFAGAMTGTSKGQMFGIDTAVKDSGGYVAAERFVGTLDGKKGSFSLQHSGTMQGGKFELNIIVVPDSGTEELTGISGKMKIKIEGGKHFYELEYTLPAAK